MAKHSNLDSNGIPPPPDVPPTHGATPPPPPSEAELAIPEGDIFAEATEQTTAPYAGPEKRDPNKPPATDSEIALAKVRSIAPFRTGDTFQLQNRVLAEMILIMQEMRASIKSTLLPDANSEGAERDVFLAVFQAYHSKWTPEQRLACPWENVLERLTDDDGRALKLAAGMEQPILFGFSSSGKILVRDGGEPLMMGMLYKNARYTALYKHKKVEIKDGYPMYVPVLGPNGEQIPSGYTLVPVTKDGKKGEEILLFEQNMQAPFVEKDLSVFLESGESPDEVYTISHYNHMINVNHPDTPGIAKVHTETLHAGYSNRGVYRMLEL